MKFSDLYETTRMTHGKSGRIFFGGSRFQKSLQEELKAMFDAMDDNKDGWLGDSVIVENPGDRWVLWGMNNWPFI